MAKKNRDYGLILSLGLIITIASYWFVKEVPMDGVEHYVDLLGDKLVALIPKESDKEEVAAFFQEFRTKVKEKQVSPEYVEQMASAIINLSNASDSLTVSEAEALLKRLPIREIALDSIDLIHVPDVEATPEEWKELNERLSNVYHVGESLKDHVVVTPEGSMPQYRVDEKLNIIIDNRVRADLKEEQYLRELEEQDIVFWKDSIAESMQKDLHKLEIELKEFSADIEIQHNLLKLKVLAHPVGEEVVTVLDSLDILTLVNWDSLEGELERKIETVEIKKGRRVIVKPETRP